jgi:hypothetical protein
MSTALRRSDALAGCTAIAFQFCRHENRDLSEYWRPWLDLNQRSST